MCRTACHTRPPRHTRPGTAPAMEKWSETAAPTARIDQSSEQTGGGGCALPRLADAGPPQETRPALRVLVGFAGVILAIRLGIAACH